MRLLLGIVFALGGGAVVLVGLLGALHELVGLYSSALNDPLAVDSPEGKVVGASMMRWAATGCAGVPFLIIGVVLLKISLFQKIMRASKGSGMSLRAPERVMPEMEPSRKQPRSSSKDGEHGPRPGRATGAGSQGPAQRQAHEERDLTPRRGELGESGGNKSER